MTNDQTRKDTYVYVYTDPRKPGLFKYGEYEFDHEPIYVGKGRRHRIRDHIRYAKQNKPSTRNMLKFNKIRKILSVGLEPVIFKVSENLSNKEALELEANLIECIGRIDLETGPLTNLSAGGIGSTGYTHSLAQREHLSQVHMGKKLSDEHKRNIGLASKRRWANPEYRAMMSKIHKGRRPSREEVRKRVKTFKARGHGKWMRGRKLPESTKKKMSFACASVFTVDQVIEIRSLFDGGEYTQTEIAKIFNTSVQNIHGIVRRKTWRYI